MQHPFTIAARRALRSTIANIFLEQESVALIRAGVISGERRSAIVKATRILYSESEAKARPLIEAEFRTVLASYLKGFCPKESQLVSLGSPSGTRADSFLQLVHDRRVTRRPGARRLHVKGGWPAIRKSPQFGVGEGWATTHPEPCR